MSSGTVFTLAVNPKIPPRLVRLEELANNLWYSWDRSTRSLFSRLHPGLWGAVGHNPKAFLKRVDESLLLEAAQDQVFLANYNSILSSYDSYHSEPLRRNGAEGLRPHDQVAYFCFEFGFHESFPIYSGGLGILAGDHCKAASDLRLPFVGVGLLYRQGYFFQTIDNQGNQQVTYTDSDFEDLPVAPVLHADGSEVWVEVELPQRKVVIKVWQAKVGHVTLYLLDADLPENSLQDRDITHQLYGGDKTMRIEQEIILGVGGVRALQAVGMQPTVWHINEGHAAFMMLERMRNLTQQGQDFVSALEAVAVSTVFTTHTAVPAGHDHFSEDMMQTYFEGFYRDLSIAREEFMALGRVPDSPDFNMTALAIRSSRSHNGVSRIHGHVSARICRDLWPQIEPEENPMGYITNGVHVPTFLAQEWSDLFDRHLGHEWRNMLCDTEYWSHIETIPDHLFWSVRQSLKSQMLYGIRSHLAAQNSRNHGSDAHLDRLLKLTDPINPNILTIGFARRFATYKRATLIFENLDWLRKIILDQERPGGPPAAGAERRADGDIARRDGRLCEPEIGDVGAREGDDQADGTDGGGLGTFVGFTTNADDLYFSAGTNATGTVIVDDGAMPASSASVSRRAARRDRTRSLPARPARPTERSAPTAVDPDRHLDELQAEQQLDGRGHGGRDVGCQRAQRLAGTSDDDHARVDDAVPDPDGDRLAGEEMAPGRACPADAQDARNLERGHADQVADHRPAHGKLGLAHGVSSGVGTGVSCDGASSSASPPAGRKASPISSGSRARAAAAPSTASR